MSAAGDDAQESIASGLSSQPPPRISYSSRKYDPYDSDDSDDGEQDISEVWFAGGHGDVGGGWEMPADGSKSASHVPLAWMVREAMQAGLTFDWDKVRAMGCADVEEDMVNETARDDGNLWQPDRPGPSTAGGAHIPDITVRTPSGSAPTMQSMIDATNGDDGYSNLPQASAEPHFTSPFHALVHRAHTARIHDSLLWDCGMGFTSVAAWRLMEYLPFRRMDLQSNGSWKPIRWPLPCGEVRDIPDGVQVHGSVVRRMMQDETYRPGNLIIGGGGRGVRVAPTEYGIGEWECVAEEGDPIGEIWKKKSSKPAI
jgi:hypothetical protein